VKGSHNTGRIIIVPIPINADNNIPMNIFEPTQMTNMDKLYGNQTDRAEKGIKTLYSIPNSIIGSDSEGNFATQNMEDAFDFYNNVTAQLRQELEIELTTLFVNSIFKDKIKLPIEIKPLKYMSSKNDENEDENELIRAESQARLKGTVGGVQGVLAIQESVSSGRTQYEAAVFILKDIYGYTDESARQALCEPVNLIPSSDTVDETTKTKTVSDE